VIVGRPYYYCGSSSSNRWIQSQELDELIKNLKVVKKERDELRIKIANIDKLFQKNNAIIWSSINRQSMPLNFEETEHEDETQPPNQPLDSCQVILLHYAFFFL